MILNTVGGPYPDYMVQWIGITVIIAITVSVVVALAKYKLSPKYFAIPKNSLWRLFSVDVLVTAPLVFVFIMEEKSKPDVFFLAFWGVIIAALAAIAYRLLAKLPWSKALVLSYIGIVAVIVITYVLLRLLGGPYGPIV